MLRLLDPQRPTKGIIIGEIMPDYLWDTGSLPIDVNLCALDPSGAVLSSYFGNPTVPPTKNETSNSGYFIWKTKDVAYDAAYWTLLLRPNFGSPSWTIVLSQNERNAIAPLREFKDTFPLVALLALWTVLLLSMKQIRRTLVPLEKLREITQKIGAQNFSVRVDVHSGDEFEELGESVNAMAKRLGQQFEAVKTINKIDQAILAASNAEGIIDALLEYMPRLAPCDLFSITILDPRTNLAVSHVAEKTPRGLQKHVLKSEYSVADLRQLETAGDWLLMHEPASPLRFLSPMRKLGFRSFSIFPITVGGKVFAAIVYGEISDHTPEIAELELCRQVSHQLAAAFANVHLIEALEKLNLGTLTALARAIDAKSAWTAGHSERVTNLAIKIGKQMGLPPKDLQILHRGGLLHDIGKIGTPPAILDKPSVLTPDETATMQNHVSIGLRILEPIPGLTEALPIVAQHHEWYDGSGYPNKLAGNEINLFARIFALADVYDAMTSDRPYRAGLPKIKAIEVIKQKSGTHLDPHVVHNFLELKEISDIVAKQEFAEAGLNV